MTRPRFSGGGGALGDWALLSCESVGRSVGIDVNTYTGMGAGDEIWATGEEALTIPRSNTDMEDGITRTSSAGSAGEQRQ